MCIRDSYNPDRHQALSHTYLVDSLEDVTAAIGKPKFIATSAHTTETTWGYTDLRQEMERQGGDYLLLLGTGWGLTDDVMSRCDYRLRPIYGVGEYNHLSVRSAASIMLDRLLGEK